MNNKRLGTQFENEFCELLKKCGYWAHFMSPSANGSQPCDIIACRDNIPFLIDCKTCEDKVFRIGRLEDNQKFAFYTFTKAGNCNCYIAVKHKSKIYMIDYDILCYKEKVELKDEFLFEKQGFN